MITPGNISIYHAARAGQTAFGGIIAVIKPCTLRAFPESATADLFCHQGKRTEQSRGHLQDQSEYGCGHCPNSVLRLTSSNDKSCDRKCCLHSDLYINGICCNRDHYPDNGEQQRQHEWNQGDHSGVVSIPSANEIQASRPDVDVLEHLHGLMILRVVEAVRIEEIDDFGR